MTREEYEQRRHRLEEQLREGIELLQAGFRQQLRALEMVWTTTADEDGVLPRQPSEGMSREGPAALDHVPRIFDRHDLLKALGYVPDRSSLHRVMKGLIQEGILTLKSRHAGKIPARYEKADAVAT